MLGAHVTGVDNAAKQEFMYSIGADQVIDYKTEKFTRRKEQFDLILDMIAHHSAFSYLRPLRPGGRYFMVGGSFFSMIQAFLLGPVLHRATNKRVGVLAVPQNRKDLGDITDLCVSGKIRPIIDRIFTLDETPKAMEHVHSGQSKGKVVIRVEDAA